MSVFEEEYEQLVGPRKAKLFAGFLKPANEPLHILEVGAGTLPNSRYYQVRSRNYSSCIAK
jgi:hypothetical protein